MQGSIKLHTEPRAACPVTPTEGIYVILADDTPEALTADTGLFFQSIRLHPAKSVTGGVLDANTVGDIYLGRSATYLPDLRSSADVAYPVIYDVPVGQKMQLSQLRVMGKTGDGVFYSFV